jgi:hypothetical protein
MIKIVKYILELMVLCCFMAIIGVAGALESDAITVLESIKRFTLYISLGCALSGIIALLDKIKIKK